MAQDVIKATIELAKAVLAAGKQILILSLASSHRESAEIAPLIENGRVETKTQDEAGQMDQVPDRFGLIMHLPNAPAPLIHRIRKTRPHDLVCLQPGQVKAVCLALQTAVSAPPPTINLDAEISKILSEQEKLTEAFRLANKARTERQAEYNQAAQTTEVARDELVKVQSRLKTAEAEMTSRANAVQRAEAEEGQISKKLAQMNQRVNAAHQIKELEAKLEEAKKQFENGQ